jgi:GNAT superfamily N-acetyltransferase
MLQLRTLTAADIPSGMRIKAQAGWNQTEADWQRMLTLWPTGCFLAQWEGEAIGTSCACRLGAVGWVAMVLVDERFRGRGVGTALTKRAVSALRQDGVETIRLDATPLGRPVYEKLGFVDEYQVTRWEGAAQPREPALEVRPTTLQRMADVLRLDRAATGADRQTLLEQAYREQPEAMCVTDSAEGVTGYRWFRVGSRAVQIGPVVAVDEASGNALCDSALAQCGERPVFIDIPVRHAAGNRWAASRGLSVQRTLFRMRLGPALHERPEWLWASFGPEVG